MKIDGMNAKGKPLGIGIIGCGKITVTRHAPEYAKNPAARIIGYFDFVESRAKELADLYGGRVFSSIEELLSCNEIDAVSVCTANATHAEITIAALGAGKHVLCEKPMATTPSECEEMTAAARAAGKRLMIAQNQRMMPAHIEAKRLIEAGEIGKPISVTTCFGHSGPDNWSVDPGTGNWFFDKSKSAFGAMADLGVHKIDLVRYLLGCDVRETSAMLGVLDKRDAAGNPVSVEDHASAIYRMESGAIVTMIASWTFYGEENNRTTVYGTDGIMEISPADGRIIIHKKDGECRTLEGLFSETSGVIDAFLGAIIEDAPSVLDVDAVLPSMQALFATAESAKSGCRILL